MTATSSAAVAIEAGELSLGGGLLALVRPALDVLAPGGVLAVLSRSATVREDLPSWCRAERHEYLGREPMSEGVDRHLISRGPFSVPQGKREKSLSIEGRDGRPSSAAMLEAVPMPEHATIDTGFAPRGSRVEPGGPAYPFALVERERVAPPDVARLYDQAVAAQWDANRDIPWETVEPLSTELERAVGQIMTFLAENELSALYLPSRFVAQIHPAYAEVAMFLASQLSDEARHIDVFLKRARIRGGGLGISSVTTSRSLLSLLETRDFTEAAFLLSVLGEGTFLDLLTFVETWAPDEATAELARRTRADESRHVHFGLSHVRWALQHDEGLFARLQETVRRRAATLAGVAGVPAPLQDALTVYAAGSSEPRAVARGHEAFRELLATMHTNRLRRLEHAGFNAEQAEVISALHTPNFM